MKSWKNFINELKKNPILNFYLDRNETTEKRNLPFVIIDIDYDASIEIADDDWILRETQYVLKFISAEKPSVQKNILTEKLNNLGLNYSNIGSFQDPKNSNWITNYQIKLTYSKQELKE